MQSFRKCTHGTLDRRQHFTQLLAIRTQNCECMRACYRLYCRYGTDTAKCVRKWGEEVRESPCYLYGNRTAAYESTEAVGAGGPPAGGLSA